MDLALLGHGNNGAVAAKLWLSDLETACFLAVQNSSPPASRAQC